MPGTPTKAAAKKSAKVKTADERPVIYPEIVMYEARGKGAITVDQIKALLGWEKTEGENYLFLDEEGNKVRCTNNLTNRPLKPGNLELLKQERLNGRWQFNGETMIVGRYGSVLDGQHRGITTVLAEQIRLSDTPEGKAYRKRFPDPFTLETFIVYGIPETQDVINSINTGVARGFDDVMYTSPHLAGMEPKARGMAAKMVNNAVKMLWHRTGAKNNAFSPIRSHAESMDFVNNHPHVLRAVKHIAEENADGTLGKIVSPGYAAAALFMMGSSDTDLLAYARSNPRSEKKVNWSNWEKACEFFVVLKSVDDPALQPVRDAIAQGGGSVAERFWVLAKAWPKYLNGDPVYQKDIEPEWKEHTKDVKGGVLTYKRLDETPSFGGIDLGDPDEPEEEDEQDAAEKVEANKAKVDADKVRAGLQAAKAKKKAADDPTVAMFERDKKEWPNSILLYRISEAGFVAWAEQAEVLLENPGLDVQKSKHDGAMVRAFFTAAEYPAVVKILLEEGRKVTVLTPSDPTGLALPKATPVTKVPVAPPAYVAPAAQPAE